MASASRGLIPKNPGSKSRGFRHEAAVPRVAGPGVVGVGVVQRLGVPAPVGGELRDRVPARGEQSPQVLRAGRPAGIAAAQPDDRDGFPRRRARLPAAAPSRPRRAAAAALRGPARSRSGSRTPPWRAAEGRWRCSAGPAARPRSASRSPGPGRRGPVRWPPPRRGRAPRPRTPRTRSVSTRSRSAPASPLSRATRLASPVPVAAGPSPPAGVRAWTSGSSSSSGQGRAAWYTGANRAQSTSATAANVSSPASTWSSAASARPGSRNRSPCRRSRAASAPSGCVLRSRSEPVSHTPHATEVAGQAPRRGDATPARRDRRWPPRRRRARRCPRPRRSRRTARTRPGPAPPSARRAPRRRPPWRPARRPGQPYRWRPAARARC